MHTKYNQLAKTLGPLAAQLVLTLYERQRPVFHSKEAERILGDRERAKRIVSGLVRRGIATRLKPGIFRLVPFELGFEREYLGNAYVVAREIALRGHIRRRAAKALQDYYLSHGSAFDLHQMVTQPQLVVYVSSPRLIRPGTIQGTEFRFIRCKPSHLFGITEKWVDKTEKVRVSDLERTLLDGLKQPEYCGGITEVAKALSIKHDLLNAHRLVEYALKLEIGAVIRRLGYLMELYRIGSSELLARLQSELSATYHLLDPGISSDGKYHARWRLRLNISEAELLAVGAS
ncbi:MAG: transcriptional regulator [Deltaproteobacteria bacterium]|nr:transcriptional regulator [Deltaproteobacteria bacterium]